MKLWLGDGFDLEDNENKEGLEMLANEEAAERARFDEEKEVKNSASVKVVTIELDSA